MYLVALVALLALAAAGSAPAQPPDTWQRCNTHTDTVCGYVTAPLDARGRRAGSVRLFVQHLKAAGTSKGALFLLTGGPGGASTQTFDLAGAGKILQQLFPGYDLVAYDDRGTGRSGPLACPGLAAAVTAPPAEGARLAGACGRHLGTRRLFYSTAINAADTDAVRRALGLDRIALYGVSYGTRHALAYAAAYPAHVSRLVLDSVVPLDSSESFRLPTLHAIPQSLRDICRAGACRSLSRNPTADFARLANRLERKPVVATVTAVRGKPQRVKLGGIHLLSLAVDSDLNPGFAAELPATVAAALAGRLGPLVRLAALEDAWAAHAPVNLATETATVCADDEFPWKPATPVAARPPILAAAASALGARATAPFGPWSLQVGNASACEQWPEPSGAASPRHVSFPNVPVLVLSGGRDTRTPAASGRLVAGQFPKSTLLVVDGIGHGVLFESACAARFVIAWWNGEPTTPCSREPLPLAPIGPLPSAHTTPLAAVMSSMREAQASGLVAMQIEQPLAGLHGGTLKASAAGPFTEFRLESYSDVPGIVLSGLIDFEGGPAPHWAGVVTVAGKQSGRLTFHDGRVTGTLGGRHVSARFSQG
jgi:pimeloyl-ACP methyl ester carboxylesterase